MSDLICPACQFPFEKGVTLCPLCHTPLDSEEKDERQKTSFQEAKTGAEDSIERKVAGALVATSGTQVSAFVLFEGRTVIGREEDCTIQLPDGKVSSRHGTIFIDGKRDRFIDDSTNGSVVNGEVVFCDAISLENGAKITMGDSSLLVLLANN